MRTTPNTWTYAVELATVQHEDDDTLTPRAVLETRPRDTAAEAHLDALALIGCSTLADAVARLGPTYMVVDEFDAGQALATFTVRRLGAYGIADETWTGAQGSYRTHADAVALADAFRARQREAAVLAAARAESLVAA